jgi:hypothetical protein
MDVQSSYPLELTAFVQLCLNDKIVEEYELRSATISIGRSPDCDITIDNAAVSSFHALLGQRGGKLTVEDAASTNGVLVNGSKKSCVELVPGESVQIAGKYSLRLVNAPTGVPTKVSATSSVDEGIQKETVLVDTSTLAKLGNGTRPAYLTLSLPDTPSWICRLDKASITIGRKRSCDIRSGGWFAPGVLASIERCQDGYYLKVQPTHEVSLDGHTVSGEHLLHEGSRLRVQNLSGVFHERTSPKHT